MEDSNPRQSLELIYHRLGGPDWLRQEHWLSSLDVSQWSGVTCNAEGQITSLELSQNNLKGRLADVVDVLPRTLEQLWLSENRLTGPLPAALALDTHFPSLTILDVGSNRLKGALHPVFASSSRFSWFDITGNELTSYFRYQENPAVLPVLVVASKSKTSSPLPFVHVVESLLSPESCQELIDLALHFPGGWQTDRHKEYPTTDMDVAVVGGDLLAHCNRHLETAILPVLAQLFELPLTDLALEDLFLAQYGAQGQTSLPPHRDGSELSFVITLNQEFQGGGTEFVKTQTTIAPRTPGTAVLFCGRLEHAGVPVAQGTRYILAGFVRVYPSTETAVERLQEILKSGG